MRELVLVCDLVDVPERVIDGVKDWEGEVLWVVEGVEVWDGVGT